MRHTSPRHYRVTVVGTVDIEAGDRRCSRPMNDVTDEWTASDVDLNPALRAMSRVLAKTIGRSDDVSGTGMPTSSSPNSSSRMSPSPTPSVAERVIPLRTVAAHRFTTSDGKPGTATTTIEYLDFTYGAIDRSVFTLPADVRVTDMRQFASRRPAINAGSMTRDRRQRAAAALCG